MSLEKSEFYLLVDILQSILIIIYFGYFKFIYILK